MSLLHWILALALCGLGSLPARIVLPGASACACATAEDGHGTGTETCCCAPQVELSSCCSAEEDAGHQGPLVRSTCPCGHTGPHVLWGPDGPVRGVLPPRPVLPTATARRGRPAPGPLRPERAAEGPEPPPPRG